MKTIIETISIVIKLLFDAIEILLQIDCKEPKIHIRNQLHKN